MKPFTAHLLRFRAEVKALIHLNKHKGSAIRGALFHALRNQFCCDKRATSCHACSLYATCPICFLVAPVRPRSERGIDIPRPYTIEPPLEPKTRYEQGDAIEFGMTIFARALDLFPYIVLAVRELQHGGLGKRLPENGWGRGTFVIEEIWAENPLMKVDSQVLQRGYELVHVPDLPILHEQVMGFAESVGRREQVTVYFKTPTRLTDEGRLVHKPEFRVLIQRLLERISTLAREYGGGAFDEHLKYHLVGEASEVELVRDGTRWVDLESYSTRKRGTTPIGGLVGEATYEGDLTPFLPWLIWGQFTHVGKNAVKGDGWYELVWE